MRKILTISMLTVFLTGAAAQVDAGTDPGDPKKVIKTAPAAPKFTDEERQRELAERRTKVGKEMSDDSMLILFSADAKIYSNSVDYHYRQENNLYYLTALRQNGVSLVLTKKNGKIDEYLFLPKRNPRFETWNGRMYSNEDAVRLSGIKTILDAQYFKQFLDAVAERKPFEPTIAQMYPEIEPAKDVEFSASPEKPSAEVMGALWAETVYLIHGNKREFGKELEYAERLGTGRVRNAAPIFAGLRLVKSPYEIRLMRHAIDITNEALMRSMGMIGRAAYEYEVQAEVEYTFRRRNADYWGYPSIVGCGPNATTLHYIESQGEVRKGDLMLMDVGAEYEHYTADITRTFPVNGKFTREQAEIYRIVYDAQEAAAKELKPGSSMNAASKAARKVIAEGLLKLGLITDLNSGQELLWYMHGWGHWLGMNVHDVGSYGAVLQEGMIMTNEPGIYIRADTLENLPDTPANREFREKVRPAFEKYKNIGVRIEDDMLITKDGVEWMTDDLPRTIKDVEEFMKQAEREMSRYALRSAPTDMRFAVYGNFADPTLSHLLYGRPNRLSDGTTIRGGWVGGQGTAMIHRH